MAEKGFGGHFMEAVCVCVIYSHMRVCASEKAGVRVPLTYGSRTIRDCIGDTVSGMVERAVHTRAVIDRVQ